MTCPSCHREIADHAAFCPHCGTPAATAAPLASGAPTVAARPTQTAGPPPAPEATRTQTASDPDTERARRRHERRRRRSGLADDQEQFGLPLPDVARVKEVASQVSTAATNAWGGAAGAGASTPGTLAGHLQRGYAATNRTAAVGMGVIVLSLLLLLGLGGMTAAAVEEMGYNSFGEVVGVLGASITFLVASMFFLAGLNLRASAAARRAALDAGVLASDFDDDTKARFNLPVA